MPRHSLRLPAPWTRLWHSHVRQQGSSHPSGWLRTTVLLRASGGPPAASTFGAQRESGHIPSLEKVRNVGIVAHIDAGKTTTTERMLFYAGVTKRVGDVDSGTTTTDFMKEEADRGITIQSAAVSLRWRDHNINLIDTPGHVDFTVEVERALRVVDGVVALFDASAGVQAQSYTVLQQCHKFQVPLIAFLNKMDKYNADYNKSVESIRTKLQLDPLLLQLPLHAEDGSFAGVVDVVEQAAFRFVGDHGSEMQRTDLSEINISSSPASSGASDPELLHLAHSMRNARHRMIEQLTAADDALSEVLIEQLDSTDGDEDKAERHLPIGAVRAAIRRTVVQPPRDRPALIPVLCGASRRDQGVQPLLDAVNYYLPSPCDRHLSGYTREGIPVALPPVSAAATVPTVALAFKVMHVMHPEKGQRLPLVFLRVYSGRIAPRMRIENRKRQKTEQIEKLYVMHANHPIEVPFLEAGQIGAAFLPHTYTGDTMFSPPTQHLLQAKQHLKPWDAKEEVYTLEGIQAPPAVISYSIEAATNNQLPLLKEALTELCREDPSLRTSESQGGNMVVSGMGELHLEIIMSRLANEYHVSCRLLRAIIEYRETIRTSQSVERHICQLNEVPYVECSFELRPLLRDGMQCGASDGCSFRIDSAFEESYISGSLQLQKLHPENGFAGRVRTNDERSAREELRVITSSFQSAVEACTRLGPLAGLPMHGVEVVLTYYRKTAGSQLQERHMTHAARSLLLSLLKGTRKEDLALLEPMMEVEVHLSEPEYIGNVVSSLNEHQALTVDVQEDGRSVRAIVAMRNTLRYTMELRKAVKGHANLFMKLYDYRVVEEKAVLARIMRNLGFLE